MTDIYAFGYYEERKGHEVSLMYISDTEVYDTELGSIYSMIDYINNNSFSRSKILFSNFSSDNIKYVISKIVKYKNIDSFESYNCIIISDKKKKVRELDYAKMD